MNIVIFISGIFSLLGCFIHIFFGDKDIVSLKPSEDQKKIKKWIKTRCGWHWISFDLLAFGILLIIISTTEIFKQENMLLLLSGLYFLGYSLVWLMVILIERKPKNFVFELKQWIYLLIIGCLIFWGRMVN